MVATRSDRRGAGSPGRVASPRAGCSPSRRRSWTHRRCVERQVLQPDVHQLLREPASRAPAQHARRLVDPDDATSGPDDRCEVLAGAARRIQDDAAGRTRRQQSGDESAVARPWYSSRRIASDSSSYGLPPRPPRSANQVARSIAPPPGSLPSTDLYSDTIMTRPLAMPTSRRHPPPRRRGDPGAPDGSLPSFEFAGPPRWQVVAAGQ